MYKFNHADSITISDIVTQTSKVFKVEEEGTEINNYIYFDTFDWRLYRNKLCLTKSRNSFTLSKLSNSVPLTSLTVNLKKNFPFWWDFPECRLKAEQLS